MSQALGSFNPGKIEDYLSWLIEIDRKTLGLTGLDVWDLLIPTHNGKAMKEFSPVGNRDFDFSLRHLNSGRLKRKLARRYPKFLRLLGQALSGYPMTTRNNTKHLLPFLSSIALLFVRIHKGFANVTDHAPDFLIAQHLSEGLHRVELVLHYSPNFSFLDQ